MIQFMNNDNYVSIKDSCIYHAKEEGFKVVNDQIILDNCDQVKKFFTMLIEILVTRGMLFTFTNLIVHDDTVILFQDNGRTVLSV